MRGWLAGGRTGVGLEAQGVRPAAGGGVGAGPLDLCSGAGCGGGGDAAGGSRSDGGLFRRPLVLLFACVIPRRCPPRRALSDG